MNATYNGPTLDEIDRAADAEARGGMDSPEYVPDAIDDGQEGYGPEAEGGQLIAARTEEEVREYHLRYGGSWQEARNAVDKRHLLEAVSKARNSASREGTLYALTAIVEELIERTHPR